MFIQTWNKYLPIIKILLKRSVKEPQTLDMNSTDFRRAAGGRKVKFTFSISLVKGRMRHIIAPAPLARDLLAALEQDEVTKAFIRKQDLELSMNTSFQLTIKNITEPVVEETSVTESSSDAENSDETTEPEVEANKEETVSK